MNKHNILRSPYTYAAGLIGAAALGGSLYLKDERADWNEKKAEYRSTESGVFTIGNAYQCLNRTVIFKAGVVYRKTPDSIDNEHAPVIHVKLASGNQVGKVEDGTEMTVRQPLWYIDRQDTTWIGFRTQKLSNISHLAVDVAAQIDWVNYSKLLGTDNMTVRALINSNDTQTVPCDIPTDGRVLIGDRQVAYATTDIAGGTDRTLDNFGYFDK